MPLGIVEDARLERNEVRLDPATALLLYTDGVVDARNPEREFFGRERMLEVVRETLDAPSGEMPLAREVQEALLAQVFGFMGDEPQFDDVTLMVVARGE
jgi:sigma-B regulation protein RsbU (phosphoserine phosphatase)